MTTKLQLTRDRAGLNTYGRVPPTDIWGGPLTAGVAYTFDLPTSTKIWLLVFSYTAGSDVFVRIGGTAAVPGALGSLTVERLPASYQVVGGETVSVITADANITVTIGGYDVDNITGNSV